jgi:DICT domain-containing protein
MSLRRRIEFVRRHEKELSLFNLDPDDPIAGDLRRYFRTQNLRVTVRHTASGAPEDTAVLSDGSGVLVIVAASTLRELIDRVPSEVGELGVADAEYESVLRHLKETTFTSSDTEQLLYASREIEDRARRVGRGSIHAGFQRCSIMATERSIYTDLADRGVSVHAYGIPDAPPPDLGTSRVHTVQTAEIADTWFVVFDGGGDDAQKTALLAAERDADEFYGVWTYDPGIVDDTIAYLERTYCSSNDGRTV